MDGTFINNEGRAQRFKRVMKPGLPVKGLEPALHPSHTPRHRPPGSDVRPAWQVAAALLERLGGDIINEPLTGRWEYLRDLDPERDGLSIL